MAGEPLRERALPDVVVGGQQVEHLAVLVPRGVEGPAPVDSLTQACAARGLSLTEAIADASFTAKPGSVLPLALATSQRDDESLAGARRALLIGLGAGAVADYRHAGAALARASRGCDEVGVSLVEVPAEHAHAFLVGLLVASHAPLASGRTDRSNAVAQVRLLEVGDEVTATVADAVNAARATWLARDLAGVPSSVKNPPWLARTAVELASQDGLTVRVLEHTDLAEQGFGGIVAVGRASATPPRLVAVDYLPTTPAGTSASESTKHVVLVGKGVTFDTGGLSLKPADAMVPMRTDMTGAAVVLAAVLAAARANVRHRVTAVLGLAENAIGADAYRPDDVLTMWNGRTVEIANTDAEGRLVLADAMAWAAAEYAPDVLVDVATLTGAATLGLGRRHAAMFATDDALAEQLEVAGESSGERVWRMPLVQDYADAVRSPIADLAHVPGEFGFGGGGAITAALFLREFVGEVRSWAHLDIAGPARADGVEHEIGKGPTGYGARLLLDWLSR